MSLYAKTVFRCHPLVEKAYNQQNTDINLLYYLEPRCQNVHRERAISVLTEGVDKIEELNEMMYDFDCSLPMLTSDLNTIIKPSSITSRYTSKQ